MVTDGIVKLDYASVILLILEFTSVKLNLVLFPLYIPLNDLNKNVLLILFFK